MAEQSQGAENIDAWALLNSESGIAETGGEENGTATDFSRFWSIALLIEELEGSNKDYVLVFEYLQDVAVLSGGDTPTKVVLYQVKKRERNSWTRAALLKKVASQSGAEKATASKRLLGASPLGKLYVCVEAASKVTNSSGVFLSDGAYELRMKSEALLPLHSKIRLDQLGLGEEFRIRQSLTKELKNANLEYVDSISLQQCRMTPGGMREYAHGVIWKHIDETYPGRPNAAGTVLEKLLFEFSKRSGNTPLCNSLQEILEYKGFSRRQFRLLLDEAIPKQSWDDRLATLIADLKSAQTDARTAERWRRHAQTLHIRLVGTPKVAQAYGWDTAVRIARLSDLPYEQLLRHIAESIREEQSRAGDKSLSEDERFATGIVAILYVENEPTPTNPESEVETK